MGMLYVILFLCNVIKMIKMVARSRYFIMIYLLESWHFVRISSFFSLSLSVQWDFLHRFCLLYECWSSDRAKYSQMENKKNDPIKHLVEWFYIFFILVACAFVVRFWWVCCCRNWVKSPPKWRFSFFFSLHSFRQMLSESCYYYNEFRLLLLPLLLWRYTKIPKTNGVAMWCLWIFFSFLFHP